MPVTLEYTADTTLPIEAECIRPDHLRDKSAAEIAKLPCMIGNRDATVGDFFKVAGSAADAHVVVEGECPNVKWVGAEMAAGRLTIRGCVGMHLGAEMTGGTIEVHGQAGDWVGAEMRGGLIHVHGSAGHLVGAGYRGSRLGMRGGTILIDGDVKNELGSTMRRGLIAVAGSTGDFAGVSMIAGSVFVFGQVGQRPGADMKRGTVALLGETRPHLLPTFKHACTFCPPFLTLYLQRLHDWGLPIDLPAADRAVTRYNGDLVSLGHGEILYYSDLDE